LLVAVEVLGVVAVLVVIAHPLLANHLEAVRLPKQNFH
jgi:hypothetical protein